MSAAEDQGWQPRNEAQRLAAKAPRFCSGCKSWGRHFADECPDRDESGMSYRRPVEERQRWCSKCKQWGSHATSGHDTKKETG